MRRTSWAASLGLCCLLLASPALAVDDDATILDVAGDPVGRDLEVLEAAFADDVAMDPDGARYRTTLALGRRLAREGNQPEALRALAHAAASRHDDGRAAADLVHLAREAGYELLEATVEHVLEREVAMAPRFRAAMLYERGRAAADDGEIEEAMGLFLESMALRPSPIVARAAQRLEAIAARRGEGGLGVSEVASVVELEPASAPCSDAGAECRVLRSTMSGDTMWSIVVVVDSDEYGQMMLFVSRGGQHWARELGELGGSGLAGTSYGSDVERLDAIDLDGPAISLSLASHDVDYDWCDAYGSFDASTLICRAELGGGAACVDVRTLSHGWAGPGRYAFAEPDPDAGDAEELTDECGNARGLRTSAQASAIPVAPAPTARVDVDEAGRLRLTGALPPALLAVHDFASLVAVALAAEDH